MEKLRWFANPGIGATVLLPGKRHAEDYLTVDTQGILTIPHNLKPAGFHLVLAIPRETPVVINQKNVAQDKGGYHRYFLALLGVSSEGFAIWSIPDILVIRAGKNVWTDWHDIRPNRVDCWLVKEGGHVDLFQVGVVTHDDGRTFRLLGDYRWRGQLYQDKERGVVGKPDHSKWGKFDVRRSILDDSDFRRLLNGITLQPWQGKPEELDPLLDSVPGNGYAIIDWYTPFAGQKGQGIAKDQTETSYWVLGQDLLVQSDENGIQRLERGDLITFEGEPVKWGDKHGPLKLLCVRRA